MTFALLLVAQFALVAAIGIAVVRYRLYAIERARQSHARLRDVDAPAPRRLRGDHARARRRRRRRLRVGRGPGDARRGARVPSPASRVQDLVDRRYQPRSVRGCSAGSAFEDEVRDGVRAPEEIGVVLAEALQDPLAEIFFWIPETRGVRRHDRREPRRVSRTTSVLVARSSRDDITDRVAAARSDAARASRSARRRPRRGRALDRDGAPPGRGPPPARRGRGFARAHRRGRLRGAPSARARPPRRRAAASRLARRAGQAPPAHVCLAKREILSPALDQIVAEIGAAIADLRQIAAGVRPARLDEGLAAALRDLASTLAGSRRCRGDRRAGARERRSCCVLRRLRGAHERRQARDRPRRSSFVRSRTTARCTSPSPTTASAVPSSAAAPVSPACETASPRTEGRWRS